MFRQILKCILTADHGQNYRKNTKCGNTLTDVPEV